MSNIAMKDMKDTPYLYVDVNCTTDPEDISKHCDIAFAKVRDFAQEQGIETVGDSLSVYYEHNEKVMKFRAGYIVTSEDVKKAEGDVKGDSLPAIRAVNFIHKGPYANLRNSYAMLMEYIANNSMQIAAPTAEIYIRSPEEAASEAELETDIYVAVAA
ncbi:GyrI-like domain-containing protein [uncultured Ruegeria sp.]|uniref:GyrI-like domain-containing protein n=1 Tax=uncultured Ruegeria sp. TaxID=259304 RepID=UPI0026124ADE|nr:GyrI-like domain-containing protein [uncultured Ruegeria sp.]